MLLTQRDSGGHGSAVDPEGHPGQHDHQGGGKVGLEQEEEDVATQREVDVQTVVPACGAQEEADEIPSQRQNKLLSWEPFFPHHHIHLWQKVKSS